MKKRRFSEEHVRSGILESGLSAIRSSLKPVAFALSNDDNSMFPTIKPGDIVIVDRNDCPPMKNLNWNGIYLVCGDGLSRTCIIKRVVESKDQKSWILLSDNLDYAPIVLSRDQCPYPFVGRIIASWSNHLK